MDTIEIIDMIILSIAISAVLASVALGLLVVLDDENLTSEQKKEIKRETKFAIFSYKHGILDGTMVYDRTVALEVSLKLKRKGYRTKIEAFPSSTYYVGITGIK